MLMSEKTVFAIGPENYEGIHYFIAEPTSPRFPTNAPPPLNEEDHVLFVGTKNGKFAYYWLSDAMLDDVDIDIWALIWPSISAQLGIRSEQTT